MFLLDYDTKGWCSFWCNQYVFWKILAGSNGQPPGCPKDFHRSLSVTGGFTSKFIFSTRSMNRIFSTFWNDKYSTYTYVRIYIYISYIVYSNSYHLITPSFDCLWCLEMRMSNMQVVELSILCWKPSYISFLFKKDSPIPFADLSNMFKFCHVWPFVELSHIKCPST